MTKPPRFLLLSGAFVLVVVLVSLLGFAARTSGGLEQYQAELRAKGEKLTFAEIIRGRPTRAFDTHAVITNAARNLGDPLISPGLLELRNYTGPGQARANWAQADPLWSQSSRSDSNATWADIVAHVEAKQSTLAEIRQALKDPAPDAGPGTRMLTERRVNFVAIRTVALWLMDAAEAELHEGHLEPALQDLEAIANLARMERDEPTFVAQMIRVAVAGLGLEGTWDALQAPGWNEPQLQRLQKAWEPVDLVAAAETGLVGERAGGYEKFTQIRHSGAAQTGRLFRSWLGPAASKPSSRDLASDYLYFPAYKLVWISDDELFYLQTMEEALTAPRLLRAHRPYLEAKQSSNKVAARLNAAGGGVGKFRYYISMVCIPNFVPAIERASHVETERQMTLAAIALKRYQLRHGTLPPALDALVPELLPTAPYDPMSGKGLCYHLKPDGRFLLYSVGEDGKDDGGDARPAYGPTYGMWEGRDAVWPVAMGE